MKGQLKGWLGGAASILLAGLFVMAGSSAPGASAKEGRSDILVIDDLKSFGPLQRPPVVFLHDRHTEALGRDCLACHPLEIDPLGKERLSLEFKRIQSSDRQKVMDIFHAGCIGCHQDMKKQQKPAGPVTCGECHQAKAPAGDFRPIGMDRSLHYRHVAASENQCQRCHHQYNPETKKLYYVKGQEESCLYCHKDRSQENRISYRLASHIQCLSCHRQNVLQGKKTGPLECAGCHGPAQQARIARVEKPPRLQRRQPDAALVRALGKEEQAGAVAVRMPLVPLNHRAHEGYGSSCRDCHHASLTPCADCHSIAGRPAGAKVTLAQAMHQPNATMSCVGCHNGQKKNGACAGCHASMPPEQMGSSEKACKVCHIASSLTSYPQSEAEAQKLAAQLLTTRRAEEPIVSAGDIPEVATIGHMLNQYEAVKMPHRRIVLKLYEATRGNRLAGAFHTEPTTLCQGCHHHSPPSLKPPLCSDCHSRTSDPLNPARPGLMAAFHQECFQCHERMGISKPASRDCTACHAARPGVEKQS